MRHLLLCSLACLAVVACDSAEPITDPLTGGGGGGAGGTAGTSAGGTGGEAGAGGTAGTGGAAEPACTFDAGSLPGGGGGGGFAIDPLCQACITQALFDCGSVDPECGEKILALGACATSAGCIGETGPNPFCMAQSCPGEAAAAAGCLANCEALRACAGL